MNESEFELSAPVKSLPESLREALCALTTVLFPLEAGLAANVLSGMPGNLGLTLGLLWAAMSLALFVFYITVDVDATPARTQWDFWTTSAAFNGVLAIVPVLAIAKTDISQIFGVYSLLFVASAACFGLKAWMSSMLAKRLEGSLVKH